MIDEPPVPSDEQPAEPLERDAPSVAVISPEPVVITPSTTAEPSQRRSVSRFAVPIIAALILIAGLTSVWWLPLVRPARHEQPATVSASETAPSQTVTAQPAAVPTSTRELAARVDRLDEAITALQDNSGSSSTKADLDELDRRVTELGRKLDNASQKPGIDPQQLAAVTDTVKPLGDRLSAINGQLQRQDDVHAHQAAFVLATAEIATAISSASSYAAPLQALKAIGDDPGISEAMTVLDKYANTEVPSRARLEWDLQQLPQRFEEAVEQTEGTGFWERLLERMERLVRIRKTADADEGDGRATPASVVAGAETELTGGDLGAAIQSMETLHGHPAELAAPWLEQAKSRLQIEHAAQALQTFAIQRLTPEAGAQP